MIYVLPVDPESKYQTMTLNLPYGERLLRVRIDLRYMDYVGRWYFSVYNAQTGDPYCLNVPVLSCVDLVNNLVEQYTYKEIGLIACCSKTTNKRTGDPGKDDIGEFELVWGDGVA